jgi:hypothetical protein
VPPQAHEIERRGQRLGISRDSDFAGYHAATASRIQIRNEPRDFGSQNIGFHVVRL